MISKIDPRPVIGILIVIGIIVAFYFSLPPCRLNCDRSSTVEGVDSDGDGVRDDIQKWIDKELSTSEPVKLATRQYAKAEQKHLTSTQVTRSSAKGSAESINRALECLYHVSGYEGQVGYSKIIKSMLLNTKQRRMKYYDVNSNISGEFFALTPWEQRKESCEFNPDELTT